MAAGGCVGASVCTSPGPASVVGVPVGVFITSSPQPPAGVSVGLTSGTNVAVSVGVAVGGTGVAVFDIDGTGDFGPLKVNGLSIACREVDRLKKEASDAVRENLLVRF